MKMFKIMLKQLREALSISQAELASRINTASSTVGMWEAGRREPDFCMLIKLANFFNVSVDYLLGYNSDNKTNFIVNEKAQEELNEYKFFMKTNFANKLIELRTEKGLSQSELADIVGTTRSTISFYELDKRLPTLELLFRLSSFFQISIYDLLGVDNAGIIRKSSETLSTYEKELVNSFRACSKVQQAQILGYAEAMVKIDKGK